ncbi:MAG: biotin synthase BioB [Abditibacteriota bacterium]|nr:biotin synthase BioB [Abditibacteriota bacterium]
MDLVYLANEIIEGRRLTRNDDLSFFETCDFDQLCNGANLIRKHFCKNNYNLCSIINGKSGKCPENCKFCAQSIHHNTNIKEYDLLDEETILKECQYNANKGVNRFAIVTAGKKLSDEDFEKIKDIYKTLKEKCQISLCGSLGLLEREQFKQLKEAGLTRYHANIETSRNFFKNICTTHSFEDKIECIERAKEAGLEICSGGIIGMGESFEDRIDMALTLAELKVDSIPINALIPIKGTPLEGIKQLSEEEIIRTCATFRYIVPWADIRLAAGRYLMKSCGEEAFKSGVNSAITGDMLTTSGNGIAEDMEMIARLI